MNMDSPNESKAELAANVTWAFIKAWQPRLSEDEWARFVNYVKDELERVESEGAASK